MVRAFPMANLETINFTPMREVVENNSVRWVRDKLGEGIDDLPQIFWNDGEPWHEANHWALTKATGTAGGDIQTVTRLMSHLAAYASWLERTGLDWRHFPMTFRDRTAVKYRGNLIKQRDQYLLAPSTTTARMAAVIQFYRHCRDHGLIQRKSPLWKDRQVVVRYFDDAGFKRAITRASSELAIPNRIQDGLRLEDGVMPLKIDDAVSLLQFTHQQGLRELNLMLSIGVLTGARIGTIRTLNVEDIENAYPDVQTPDTFKLRVGPGTGVKTKGDVEGYLLVPKFLIDELKVYAYSMQRLRRQGLASKANRGRLFLTSKGNPYNPSSFNRLMTDLRRRAQAVGMRFMSSFKFHQTRATFGTWLMGVALSVAGEKAAVAFVRDAMLHADESVTLRYVRFEEEAPIKISVANEFTAVFSGIVHRDWSQWRA